MRCWRERVGSVVLLMAVACATEVDDGRGGGVWLPTSASSAESMSASASGTDGGDTAEGTDTDDSAQGSTSDNPDPSGTSGATSSPPPSTTADPTATGGAEQTTGSGDPALDTCLGQAMNECESCGCNQCLDPLSACQMDAGCVAIRDCARESGCTDTASCYEACETVINDHGGVFSNSATLAGELADCMETSCPVCF